MGNFNSLIETIRKDGLKNSTGSIGQVIPGIMNAVNSVANSFDTSLAESQLIGINDITRDSLMNGITVNSGKKGVGELGSDAIGAAMTGFQMAGPIGLAAGAIPLIAGAFGNAKKERVASSIAEQNSLNLDAKNRQFNYQDLKSNMANFAAYGGNFSNPLTEFNEGGTHEENPNSGIMQGTGENGKPNLVEEGETKSGTYVYSNRLIVDKNIAEANNLPKSIIGKSFADASKNLTKEAKEKPNDPISKKTTEAYLSKLTQAQEMLKESISKANENKRFDEEANANIMEMGLDGGMFARGGEIHIRKSSIGKLSSAAKKSGMSTQEYAKHIIETSNDPVMIKRANFAINANNINALGGELFADGGDLTRYFDKLNAGNQIYSSGGNLYNLAGDLKRLPVDLSTDSIKIHPNDVSRQINNLGVELRGDSEQDMSRQNIDYSRYAPVIANALTGIKDIFETPEVTKYNRYSPEKIGNKLSYRPIDTSSMVNPILENASRYASEISNVSGGNRATALASMASLNKHSQEAISDAILKAENINYDRKNQIDQFNIGIDQLNVQEQNRANMYNSEIANKEIEVNAANRAAKRNAARQAVLQSATDIGMIGKENWAARTGAQMYGYSVDPITGLISYGDGTKYKKDPKTGNLIKMN